MDEARVTQVVEATLTENLGACLEPDSLTELDAIAGKKLREDTT
jgi:hypothetical protein